MRYLLPCECGRTIPVAASQAGETVTCACGCAVQAPKLRDLRQLEQAVETAPAPPRRLAWSHMQGVLFSLGIALTLLAALVLWYVSLQRNQLTTDKPAINPELLNEYVSQIDRNTPAENFEIWQKEVLEQGLTREHDPPYLAHRRIDLFLRSMMFLVGVAGVAGVGMIVAAFLVRPQRR